jgi:hypothetical chaperone protein
VIGLDFGTTNSAIATAEPGRPPRLATFADGAEQTSTFRSLLYVDPEAPDATGNSPRVSAGPAAIRDYLATGQRGRLIQSIKAHLGSRLFTTTDLFGVQYRLDDLVGLLLREMRAAAEAELGDLGHAVVCGRPARFSSAESPEDDALAEGRLRAALWVAGWDDVVFEYEPVAAALGYQARLDHEELVLIADFGGGTSDFSLVRLSPSRADIVGVDGVAVAGDAFDGRLIRRLAAPGLGLGAEYRSAFGRVLPVPLWLYERIERWDQLSFLKTRETTELLDRLRHEALEPDRIAALQHLVEDELGFQLHAAVERTKHALSTAAAAQFAFHDPPIDLAAHVRRSAMDDWIAQELAAIAHTVDGLIARHGVAPNDVDTVFLTGGSAFVPAVRAIFAARFGEHRLRGGDELTTVATGLAIRARDATAASAPPAS